MMEDYGHLSYADPETNGCISKSIALFFLFMAILGAIEFWRPYSTWMINGGVGSMCLYILSYLPIIGGLVGVIVYSYKRGKFLLAPAYIYIIASAVYMMVVAIIWRVLTKL